MSLTVFVCLGDKAVLADGVAATQGPTLSAGPTPGMQLYTTLSVTAVGYGNPHTINQIWRHNIFSSKHKCN